jgi:hypothetical protein
MIFLDLFQMIRSGIDPHELKCDVHVYIYVQLSSLFHNFPHLVTSLVPMDLVYHVTA